MSIFDTTDKITKSEMKKLGFIDILPACPEMMMFKKCSFYFKDEYGQCYVSNGIIYIMQSYGRIRLEFKDLHYNKLLKKYQVEDMFDIKSILETHVRKTI